MSVTTIRNKMFDTSVFAPAVKGSIGIDSGPVHMYGPGTNNWDISMFKNFQLGWSGYGTSVTFNSSGVLTNLPTVVGTGGSGRFGFGATSGARTERRIQIAARIYF